MTSTVPEMRSNKFLSMDIDQLRGWAAFMDKAMIASLAAVILAVATLGITTWLSFRFGSAVRTEEQAALERYKAAESHAVQSQRDVDSARARMAALEQEVSAARERAATLEREVSTARGQAATLEREVSTARGRAAALEQELSTGRGRTATLEQEVSAARERARSLEQEVAGARERAAVLEQDASAARERAVAFEQAAREANERAARTTRESATASEAPRAQPFNAAEIQQRLADLGKLVRQAGARAADRPPESVTEAPRPVAAAGASARVPAVPDALASPIVASLRKYAGTKAALFVLPSITDAQAVGSAISGTLSEAGWAPGTWAWTGVAGIFGVVVLVREGSDPATNEAGSALVEALRSAGFNVTKGDWPANWSRFRGMLDGPQTPGPTDASIRIVIGSKPR